MLRTETLERQVAQQTTLIQQLQKMQEAKMYQGCSQLYPELSLTPIPPAFWRVEKAPPISGSPIGSLPPEILSAIFEDFTDGNTNPNYKQTLERLARVCRKWRDVCIATPRCWEYIEVDHITGIDDRPFISRIPSTTTYIQRSRNRPLRIAIRMDEDDSDEVIEDVLACMEILVGLHGCHMARWRDVKLAIRHNDGNDFLQEIPYPTPMLERLEIDGVIEDDPLTLSKTFACVPQGLELALNFDGDWDLGEAICSATGTLRVDEGTFHSIYARLSWFSNVTNLVLGGSIADDVDSLIFQVPIALNSLHVIVISYPSWAPLIDVLVLPALMGIVILRPLCENGFFDGAELMELVDSLHRFMPQIEAFEITHASLAVEEWWDLLDGAIKLVRLASRSCIGLDRVLEDRGFCPQLLSWTDDNVEIDRREGT